MSTVGNAEEVSITPYEIYYEAVELINKHSIYSIDETWVEYYQNMPHLEEDDSESIMKHELFYKAIPKGGKKHSYGLPTDDSTQAVAEIYTVIIEGNELTEEEKTYLIEEFKENNEWFKYPVIENLESNIYLLTIPTPSFVPSYVIEEYVNTVHTKFNEIETVDGIIIDFRNNYGGYFPTILASLAAFLPEGELLYYENNSGERSVIKLTDKQVLLDDEPVWFFDSVDKKCDSKVAIIIDNQQLVLQK